MMISITCKSLKIPNNTISEITILGLANSGSGFECKSFLLSTDQVLRVGQ